MTGASTTTDITLGKDVGVNVGAIEKELAAMWRGASKDKQVTRACSLQRPWIRIMHPVTPRVLRQA